MITRAHATRVRTLPVFIAFLVNVVAGPLSPLVTTPVFALEGTSFNARDGNLIVDGLESDWCTAPNFVRTDDLPSGQTDNAYKAAKENELNPQVEFGSIPNNKVDLDRIYISSETTANEKLFVYLGWVRNDTTGTGTISFELNQSDVVLSNGINHQRTVGDLLFEFNFQANPGSLGGYTVTLTYRVWDGSAWGDSIPMGGFAEGSVNALPTVDCINLVPPELQLLGIGAFGEFAVNLTDLLGGDCRAFASIFAKSRSSNQITSELKEVVAPTPIDLSTCGQITILKHDPDGQLLGGATFSVTPNPFTLSGSLSVTDGGAPDDDATAGIIHLSDVEPGTYTVCETAAPAGYILDPDCVQLTVGVNGSATFGPFVNGLGAISWTKLDDETGLALGGATFSLAGIGGAAAGFGPITVVDNGANDGDADAGELLVSGLQLGTYRITETAAPAGYDLPDPAFQDVVLSGASASPASAFRDPPHPVLSVAKTPDGGVVTAGDPATFTIVTSNLGPGTALGATLADALPVAFNGWSIVVAQTDWADCEITGTAGTNQVLTCGPENIAPGDDRTVAITTLASVEDCGTFPNLAEADAANADPASDPGDITITCAALSLAKTPDGAEVTAGDAASFTIVTSNAGDGEARDATLTDDLPAVANGWTLGTFDWAECEITGAAGSVQTLTCGPEDLEAAGDRSVTVTTTVTADDCGELPNLAEVSTSNDGSPSDAGDITVLCPDVSIDKEPIESPISAGEQARFSIVVENIGDGEARDIVVTDTAPSGTVWTVLDDGGMTCADEVVDDQQTITCALAELAAGASVEILIAYTTTQADCGTLDNAVAVEASNEAQADMENNTDEASIVVECPGLNIVKIADADPIDAGQLASFTITVWNAGPGIAFDVVVEDDLPAGISWNIDLADPDADDECASSMDSEGQSFSCEFGTLPVTDMAGGKVIVVSGDTDRDDCGQLDNTAFADASNDDEVSSSDSIMVKCPTVAIVKSNDASAPVLPGTNVGFTLTVTVGDGPANDVAVVDTLPAGYDAPTIISDGGTYDASTRQITWSLGDLASGSYELTYQARVSAGVANGAQLVNVAVVTSPNSQCPDLESLEPECDDDSTVVVRVPTLVIDKVANVEVITISGAAGSQTANPSVITWTLTYTLTNGPVTNAVITDVVPAGLNYLSGSASNGGVYDAATRTLTWTFATLSASGSVTFQTSVDVATISRTAPTENVAVIDSNETTPDDGRDSVTVTVIPPPLAGTPTPRPVPNTAMSIGTNGQPVTIPIELLAAFFLGSLGALASANVVTVRRRRR